MINVTPIGSCRITAPLRYGHSNYGIHLNLDRCYGYCHSPAEAVQMARFLRGEVNIPHEVWPLVSRSHQLDVIATQKHTASDLYVIELASAKELTIDGVSIQLNYLNAIYKDFFSDPERTQGFWACAEAADEDAMSAFLEAEWSASRVQRAQSTLLGQIRLKFVTRESLRRDIRKLAHILPDVLFVSHVDACRPNGQKIGSRSNFINLVEEEVSRAEMKFYNPTNLMVEFGQPAAIEDESTSLAHFTTSFCNAVMDDWMRGVIAPKTDIAVREDAKTALPRLLQPQIDAALRCGRFCDMRARLASISAENEQLEQVLEDVDRRMQDARQDFERGLCDRACRPMDTDERSQFINDAGELGLFEAALSVATQPPDGLAPLPAHLLIKVGLQALAAGDTDNAFEFVLTAYLQNNASKRASAVLADLAINEEIDILGELDTKEMAGFLSHLTLVQKFHLLQLNGAAPTAAISKNSSPSEIVEIATYLAEHESIPQAAKVLACWRDHLGLDRLRDQALVEMLNEWVEAALKRPNVVDRLQDLNEIIAADPHHPGLRNAIRDLRVDLVHRVRAAGKDGDIEALDALKAEVDALRAPLPEFDLWRARLKFVNGDFEEAIEFGQSVVRHMPENINVWVLLMRAASRTRNGGKSGEFARKVIDLACAKTEKLKAEAEAVLQTQAVGA